MTKSRPSPPSEDAVIDPYLDGKRLDHALAALWPQHTRSRLQGLVAGGHVSINNAPAAKSNLKVKEGDVITIIIPPAVDATPKAQKIPLNIVYEDKDILVVDKPAGMVVHPAAGNYDGTLVNALLAHCKDLSGINGVKRPGIVHRLDKETSGLLVAAKNDAAHNGLAEQFAGHNLRRTYLAVVHGMPPASGTVETLIGRDPKNRQRQAVVTKNGKEAVTHFKREKVFAPDAALVRCELETGRTHQIRVHMQHIGFPLVGDPLYGKKRALKALPDAMRHFPRQALHAAEIAFTHPVSGKKLKFTSALPDDMRALITALEAPTLKR
ncbi:MAG: RluA family pseudouridine synthase [Bdellovibrionales bacterium]